ncbi:MAG: hypothetical protein WBM63_15595, partial [Sedimenticolaceae bacterium]
YPVFLVRRGGRDRNAHQCGEHGDGFLSDLIHMADCSKVHAGFSREAARSSNATASTGQAANTIVI